jgi:hypothetical protein
MLAERLAILVDSIVDGDFQYIGLNPMPYHRC